MNATQFTKQEFFSKLLNFRELMGDKTFWAKSGDLRQKAVDGFTFCYTNSPIEEDVISAYYQSMTEYSKREGMMFMACRGELGR